MPGRISTQTLFESGEDFLTRDGLDASRVHVIDTALDLFFPFLTEIEAVQTCRDRFDQVSAREVAAQARLRGLGSVRPSKGILAGCGGASTLRRTAEAQVRPTHRR
jgi:hypothetical protein